MVPQLTLITVIQGIKPGLQLSEHFTSTQLSFTD